MQKEILQEIFFEAPTIDAHGVTIPAPPVVHFCRDTFLHWYKQYPQRPDVAPYIGFHPVREPGREGYVAQRVLIHKDQP